MILIPPLQTAQAGIDKAIQIIERQRIGSFVASFSALEGKTPRKGSYEVAYIRPDQLKLRAKLPSSDRTYWIDGSSLFAVDHRDREWLVVKSPKVGSALQRMAAAVPVDEPVRLLVDPAVGKNFLSTFKEIRVWTKSGRTWTAKDGRGKFSLTFDSAGRFSAFRADSPAGWISWTYSYPPPLARAVYPDTSGFTKVDGFYDTATPIAGLPKFSDPSSKAAVERAVKEYGRLRSVAYSVSDEAGTTHVWLGGREVRQKSMVGEWSWIGKKLNLKKGKKMHIVGKQVSLRELDQTVSGYNCALDPFLSKLLRRQNPMLALLGSDLKARFVGTLGFSGVTCNVVELKGPGIRMTLTLRKDSGLIHAVSSENLDSNGRVLAKSEKRYAYSAFGAKVVVSPVR